ncbi:hypothetical protein FE257_010387 [Aspergillus nanangensis]|uniref:Serine hydrolase FSH domain-containing protein n=1 Tax=Aspergillus nanangensis TaxID=2582783 RepID=A0AAD4CIM7_ASPNN|nr:hypothetical protein FE257_010387 [Aspergillus nanangensis]
MRFLCLHGIGSNANVFQAQLASIQQALGSQHEFVFIQGEIPSQPGPGVDGLSNGPYYSFFSAPTAPQLHAAFDIIDQALDMDGPFDGVMGFSQGASIVASYLLRTSAPDCPFKCAAFFCASMPFNVESISFHALEDGSFKDSKTGEDVSDEIRLSIPEVLDLERYTGLRGQTLHRRYAPDGSAEINIPTMHMGSEGDLEQTLLGSWSLVEYSSTLQEGGKIYPMGPDTRGILLYSPGGYMGVQLLPKETKKVKSTIHDILAYTGRYWVAPQHDGRVIVKHHMQMCSAPEFEGSIQQRVVSLSGDRLTLSCPSFVSLEVSSGPAYKVFIK